MFKDNEARALIEELIKKLGFSGRYYGAGIARVYDCVYGAENMRDEQPVQRGDMEWVMKRMGQTEETLQLLLDHLDLEVREGKEIRKKESIK